MRQQVLSIGVWRWPILLLLAASALTAIYLILAWLTKDQTYTVPEHVQNFVLMFDVNREGSLPSWYSASLWALAACLALLVGAAERGQHRSSWRWTAMASVFLLLSLDEGASLHENIGDVLDLFIHGEGPFAWSWIFYGMALVIAVAIALWPLVMSLPRWALASFGGGAAIFVSGALGIEMYSAAIEEETVEFLPGLNWPLILAAEEFLEMLGVIITIGTLLHLLRRAGPIGVEAR